MKAKIISALKTKYASRGFSDKAYDGVAEFLSKTVTEEAQVEDAVTGMDSLFKAFQGEVDKVRGEKTAIQKELDELKAKGESGGDPKPQPKEGDDFDAKMQKWYKENVEPLKTELDGYKAKETASARAALITTKAKDAGIPDWRIKQGFNFAPDADEAAIVAGLASIQQDIVTAGLPNKTGLPLSTTADQAKERAMKWAEGLPDKSNEKK